MATPLGHRGSDDFADMLNAAVSALGDDDLLLSGPSAGGELTMDHIHNLSTAPQFGRSPSYPTFEGSDHGGGGMYAPPPMHAGPTHIGDFIPIARPTSSNASSIEVPRRGSSPDEDAESAVSPLPSARRATPPGKLGSGGRGVTRSGSSGGTAPLASPGAARKGGLPRVAMLSKPPPKKEEPLSPQRPSRQASMTRSPSSNGRGSAGPSPSKSAPQHSRSNSASVVQRSTGSLTGAAAAAGSRIPRPPGLGGSSPGSRPASAASGVAEESSARRNLSSPQRSFGGSADGSPPKPGYSPQRGLGSPTKAASTSAGRANSFGASPAAAERSYTAGAMGARGVSAGAAGLGLRAAPARATAGAAGARPGIHGGQPGSPSKLDTRKQLEELMRDLQDIKKDLGLLDSSAPATATSAEAAPAAAAAVAAAVQVEAPTSEAQTAETPEVAAEGSSSSAVPAGEASGAAEAQGEVPPAAEAVAESAQEAEAEQAASAALDEASAQEAALQEAAERLASAARENEATRQAAAEAVAEQEETQVPPTIAEASEEDALPISTAAAPTEVPADRPVKQAAPLETEAPGNDASAKQCCACTVM